MASRGRGRPQAVPTPEGPSEFMDTLREMAYAMREQAAAAHQMMDQLGRQPGAGHGANQNGLGVDLEYLKFTEFRKANPPSFRGAFHPDKVNEWVKTMEKVFSVLDCTDHQKVAFATYMLEADAEFWWNGVKRLLEESQTEITWIVFKDAFYQKYFPPSVRNAKELEFMQLCQGSSSMSEYIAKFEELCKFSTIYQRNPDEAWKCVKFEGGLRENILAAVGPMEIRDFPTLVNKCRLVEDYNRKLEIAQSNAYGKRLAPENQELEYASPLKKQFRLGEYEGKQLQESMVKQRCPKCGKNHGNKPCLVKQYVCFNCGKPGHVIRECPENQPPAPKP